MMQVLEHMKKEIAIKDIIAIEKKYAKYAKMKQYGVPIFSVINKMRLDGLSKDEITANTNEISTNNNNTDTKSDEKAEADTDDDNKEELKENENDTKINDDDEEEKKQELCSICYTDPLYSAKTIKLDSCKHEFHLKCVEKMLEIKYNGARISFQFRGCPLCKTEMRSKAIENLNKPLDVLKDALHKQCLIRLEHDKLDKHADIVSNKESAFYENPLKYALKKYAYYQCFKCVKPYYVGLNRCLANGDNPDDALKEEHLICRNCDTVDATENEKTCKEHAAEFIEWKCKFCCALSTFSCGSTHFCEQCHHSASKLWGMERSTPPTLLKGHLVCNRTTFMPEKCKLDECPLGIRHPEQGTEYCLGCSMCKAIAKLEK